MRRPRVVRWRDRTQVERVDLYMRSSLYLFVWLFPLFTLWRVTGELVAQPAWAAVLLLALVLAATTGSWVLREAMRIFPARGPLPWRQLAMLAAAVALGAVVVVLLPAELDVALGIALYFVAGWAISALTEWRLLVAVALAVGLTAGAALGEPVVAITAFVVMGFFAFTSQLSLWVYSVVEQLDDARGAQSALDVAEERLRFSRDVHDVLGRRLSAIAVKSELAAALAERGDERAAPQMLEVRGVAHEALREARELARGYRDADLGRELEGARSLLRSAGIAVDADLTGLPARWDEPAAWVVREAVTNVLRHSRASRVELRVEDGADGVVLQVRNDGARAPLGSSGLGLRGLRERLEPAGATLHTDLDGERFTLLARFPVFPVASATSVREEAP